MNKELPQQPQQSEEVDLIKLFKLIGDAFDRLFKSFKSVLYWIFELFIFALKAIIANFKIIGISMLIAAVIGYALEKTRAPVYTSDMLVRPYFDSKFQLITNVNYYNALISDKDYDQLSGIFGIDNIAAKQILEFDITPGPETENDRILEYEEFIKQVDSVRAQSIYFDEFIENRSIYSGSIYQITVKSFKKDIFRSLEGGLNKTFENTYSKKKRQIRDSLISIDRERVINSLKEVDSLKEVYIEVLKNESNAAGKGTITLKDGMSLVQERVKTKEYELLDKELELRQALTRLDSQKIEEDEFFDTISSFQDVGSLYTSLWAKYSIIFPILAFLFLVFVYTTKKIILFVKNYEA
ncbi:hypothetical protein H7U19_08800 [Hyunsoonleella sp. SJ7]|uniref:Uncharacterized protein n=1 Tax=Hyunsoonleella aquatilis TaxID=2762758 RepID=A0A923H8J8_9FLAO|nr:hypothetical protein [Hyunsoonleella aquatilis]MBC3758500.1 hypothetical protein [Hyunsoonleella aquatilis]